MATKAYDNTKLTAELKSSDSVQRDVRKTEILFVYGF